MRKVSGVGTVQDALDFTAQTPPSLVFMDTNLNDKDGVDGESLMMGIKGLAVSSGSACTSASLEPSYVLRALGRSDELAHSSLRMTIGRWTTEEEIDYAVQTIKLNVAKLRDLSPLWDMYKDGIDISTIQWAAH